MKYLLFAVVILFLIGCKKQPSEQLPICEITCPWSIDCTDNFYTWSVKISHTDGTAYKLDRYKTFREEDNKLIDLQSHLSVRQDTVRKNIGVYDIINDIQKDLTDPCGKVFYFVGYISDVEVVREKYSFSHNCCHVIMQRGRREIVQ